MKIRTYCN